MKLNSKYFDNIRSIKDEKKSARQCDNLGCNGSGAVSYTHLRAHET